MGAGGFNLDAVLDALAQRLAGPVADRVADRLRANGAAAIKPRLLTVEQAAVCMSYTEFSQYGFTRAWEAVST